MLIDLAVLAVTYLFRKCMCATRLTEELFFFSFFFLRLTYCHNVLVERWNNSQQLLQEEPTFLTSYVSLEQKYSASSRNNKICARTFCSWVRTFLLCSVEASPADRENLNHLPELLLRMSDLCCWPSLLCNLLLSLSFHCTPTSCFQNLTLMKETKWLKCQEVVVVVFLSLKPDSIDSNIPTWLFLFTDRKL